MITVPVEFPHRHKYDSIGEAEELVGCEAAAPVILEIQRNSERFPYRFRELVVDQVYEDLPELCFRRWHGSIPRKGLRSRPDK